MKLLRKTYSLKRNVLVGAGIGGALFGGLTKGDPKSTLVGTALGAGVGLVKGLNSEFKKTTAIDRASVATKINKKEQAEAELRLKLNESGLAKLTLPIEIIQLQKLERDSKLVQLLSKLSGDGDEYPQLVIRGIDSSYIELNDKKELISKYAIAPSLNSDIEFSYNFNTKTWTDVKGRKIGKSGIKRDLLSAFESDLKDWQKNQYWEKDENEAVIEYIKYLIQLIKTKF